MSLIDWFHRTLLKSNSCTLVHADFQQKVSQIISALGSLNACLLCLTLRLVGRNRNGAGNEWDRLPIRPVTGITESRTTGTPRPRTRVPSTPHPLLALEPDPQAPAAPQAFRSPTTASHRWWNWTEKCELAATWPFKSRTSEARKGGTQGERL